MNKQLVISMLLIIGCVNGATATYECINETLFIYNGSDVAFNCLESQNTNIDKVMVVGGICTKGTISIGVADDHDFTYEFNYAPNETVYYTTLIRTVQETTDSMVLGLYKKITRTLYIDGNRVASYNTTLVINTGVKNTLKFDATDRRVVFGDKVVNNATLFFTEMVCQDQYAYLYNSSGYVLCAFNTIDISGSGLNNLKLGGFVGIFMAGISIIPFVGTSLYNVLFPVMVVIQYVFDGSFAFINLILNDWWYALMLLEIFCLYMATQQTGYVNILSTYINTHVNISIFIYHRILIPLINIMLTILNTIKNLIQWW